VRYRGHRGQFAAGQGRSGAESRHASGPAGEKTAAETNHQSRTSERVSAEGISGGTQPEVCASGGEARGLSPSRAARRRIGPHFPAGERAHDQRGLGGAVRQPVFPTPAASSLLPASSKQSIARSLQANDAVDLFFALQNA